MPNNDELPNADAIAARRLAAMEQGAPADAVGADPMPATPPGDAVANLRNNLDRLEELAGKQGGVLLDSAGLTELAALAAREAGDDLAHAVADMLNQFRDASDGFALAAVTAKLPIPPGVVTAAAEGRLPLQLTPTRAGEYETSVLGMFNALLRWTGCEAVVTASVAIKGQRAVGVNRFIVEHPHGSKFSPPPRGDDDQ